MKALAAVVIFVLGLLMAVPVSASGPSSYWPTYHHTNDRNGNVGAVNRPTTLTKKWAVNLDGAVYGQPLVVGNHVLVATENNTVYSLALTTGVQQWRTHLGTPVPTSALPCGDINPLGITGTPVFDAVNNNLFVVTETTLALHTLVALNASTGATRWTRNLDVSGRDRTAEQQRGALAVANGRVYAAFGGLAGDCGNYVGYLASTTTNGFGLVSHFDVPTTREGGVWAASGPAIASDGSVFFAVGNGAATKAPYDGSDSISRVKADLSARLDFFAPTTWASENAADLDLGSTGPILVTGGFVVADGKAGTTYLLSQAHLGAIGGQLATASGCTSFGGMAADGAAVFIPCTEGLERIDVSADTLTFRWRVSATGSPVVGGGAVWTLDTSSGALQTYDETTGAGLSSITVGNVSRFASPVVVSGTALVGTLRGVEAISY
jgi:outer membrane protein assembly factor BamB